MYSGSFGRSESPPITCGDQDSAGYYCSVSTSVESFDTSPTFCCIVMKSLTSLFMIKTVDIGRIQISQMTQVKEVWKKLTEKLLERAPLAAALAVESSLCIVIEPN